MIVKFADSYFKLSRAETLALMGTTEITKF